MTLFLYFFLRIDACEEMFSWWELNQTLLPDSLRRFSNDVTYIQGNNKNNL